MHSRHCAMHFFSTSRCSRLITRWNYSLFRATSLVREFFVNIYSIKILDGQILTYLLVICSSRLCMNRNQIDKTFFVQHSFFLAQVLQINKDVALIYFHSASHESYYFHKRLLIFWGGKLMINYTSIFLKSFENAEGFSETFERESKFTVQVIRFSVYWSFRENIGFSRQGVLALLIPWPRRVIIPTRMTVLISLMYVCVSKAWFVRAQLTRSVVWVLRWMISREFAVKDMEVQFKADDTGELNIVKTDLANRKFKKSTAALARKISELARR